MSALYLADKSALARLPNPAVAGVLAPLIEAGQVATCGVVDLEVLFSARWLSPIYSLQLLPSAPS